MGTGIYVYVYACPVKYCIIFFGGGTMNIHKIGSYRIKSEVKDKKKKYP